MEKNVDTIVPRLVFWELTRRCNLGCIHCRAEAGSEPLPGEFTTSEAKDFILDLGRIGKPILVLTGGEPLYRPDLFEIARFAGERGFSLALATNGTLIDRSAAERIASATFRRVSISLDGAARETHDTFRGREGSFDQALAGLAQVRDSGVSVQVNTTIARHNIGELDDILELALREKVSALHFFLLVPVGCGAEIATEAMISPREYEEALGWIYDRSQELSLEMRATCAPHYYRIVSQRERERGRSFLPRREGMHAMTRGCLAGSGVIFLSYRGDVQPCGYLPLSAGNVRQASISTILSESPLLRELRSPELLKGKCGRCEFSRICGGCRARAYGATGDYLAEEPFCTYLPKPARRDDSVAQ